MSGRTQAQRMRVLRDDAAEARANLESSTGIGLPNDERDRFIRRADVYATLSVAESFDYLATTLDAVFGEVSREWVAYKTSRQRANGADPAKAGRKV